MNFRLALIECFQFLWRNSGKTTGNYPPNMVSLQRRS